MKNKDLIYQNIVNQKRDQILLENPMILIKMDNLSTFENGEIKGAIWHHKYDDNKSHIVVQVQRPILLFTKKNYLAGIIILNQNIMRTMSDNELSEYD